MAIALPATRFVDRISSTLAASENKSRARRLRLPRAERQGETSDRRTVNHRGLLSWPKPASLVMALLGGPFFELRDLGGQGMRGGVYFRAPPPWVGLAVHLLPERDRSGQYSDQRNEDTKDLLQLRQQPSTATMDCLHG